MKRTAVIVTEDHLVSFGLIVHNFARFELLMQVIMSSLVGAQIFLAQVFTGGLGYAGKRDVVLSLLQHAHYEDDRVARIREFLDRIHQWNSLRNAVAHHNWKRGTRPDTIKPIYMVVRGGIGKMKGAGDDGRDYTAEELADIAFGLSILYNELTDYLDSIGFLPRPTAKSIEETSASTAERGGEPPEK